MKTTSLALGTNITKQFIAENPVTVTPSRRPRIGTLAGGWKFGAPANLPAVTIRLTTNRQGASGRTGERTTADGKVVVPTMLLIAMPGTDLRRFDQFTLDGKLHEIVEVHTTPAWRVSAEVFQYG